MNYRTPLKQWNENTATAQAVAVPSNAKGVNIIWR